MSSSRRSIPGLQSHVTSCERLKRLSPVLILAVFGGLLFIGLGATDVGDDEAIYSYAVDSILETGQWLAPKSSPDDDITFVEKPHLKFWIVAVPLRFGLLPHDEFGLRFWDALFGALTFLYVFLIARDLAGAVCGLFAVIVLFAHGPLLFAHGLRSNTMEAALVLSYCGGVYHFLRWGDRGSHRWGHIAAVAGWFFLGFMTKFVAVLFLPLVLGISVLVLPQMRRQLIQDWWRWGMAALAVVVLASPWFLYQHSILGDWFWHVILGEHVYNRFTKFLDPLHVQPWHFYLSEAYTQLARAGSLIWVVLGIVVVFVQTTGERTPERVLVLLWLSVPVALMSLGSSKVYHYFYPYLPPLAIAAGAAGSWLIMAAERRLVAPEWMQQPRSGSQRVAAWTVAALALTLAAATAILGTVRIEFGSFMFRNSSLVRPVLVALIAMTAAGAFRLSGARAVAMLIPLIVPTPLNPFEHNVRKLAQTERPLGTLAECIRGVDPQHNGAYAPITEPAFRHTYFYYMRGDGWRERVDSVRLRAALTVDGRERPVMVLPSDYAEFLEKTGPLPDEPVRVQAPTVLILLPGRFKLCGSAAVSGVR